MEIEYIAGNAKWLYDNGPSRVYLLFGDEDALKKEAEQALLNSLVDPDCVDFDLDILNADNSAADSVLASASQAPFGSRRRVVLVRGMEQWRDKAKQAEIDRLGAGVSALPSNSTLILVASAQEDEARRKTGISTKFDAVVREHGMLVSCKELKAEALSDWIAAQFDACDKRVSREAIDHLSAAVGGEMRSLELEILKLVAYTGERANITAEDVAAVTSTQAEDVMFQCVDAVGRRQTDRALTLLNELHRHDPKPHAVAGRFLSLLTRHFRLLWQAKFLVEKRISPRDVRFLPAEIAADLPSENSIAQVSFKASELFNASAMYNIEDLQWAFDRLVLCDLANKGGVTEEDSLYTGDPIGNLQLLVLQLTRIGSRS